MVCWPDVVFSDEPITQASIDVKRNRISRWRVWVTPPSFINISIWRRFTCRRTDGKLSPGLVSDFAFRDRWSFQRQMVIFHRLQQSLAVLKNQAVPSYSEDAHEWRPWEWKWYKTENGRIVPDYGLSERTYRSAVKRLEQNARRMLQLAKINTLIDTCKPNEVALLFIWIRNENSISWYEHFSGRCAVNAALLLLLNSGS